eukprot:Em0017g406a
MTALGRNEVQEIAREAYVFLYPVVENYRVMFYQAAWKESPRFVAPFNTFGHTTKLLDYRSETIVSPNNDTLYSVAWLDLRAQPVVLCTPAVPDRRYYSVQLVDGFTHNVAILSPRTTGSWEASRCLVTGPKWRGCIPAELRDIRVYKADSEFVFVLGRTQVYGAADLDNVRRIQRGYQVKLFSALIGTVSPPNPPEVTYPPIMPGRPVEIESFFTCANFMLQYLHFDDEELPMLKRFERIGVGPGMDFSQQSDAQAKGRDDICSGAAEALDKLHTYTPPVRNGWNVNVDPPLFGTKEVMSGRYLARAVAAHVALYGLDPDEAVYYMSAQDVDGDHLDSSRNNYVLRFAAGQLPAVKPGGFWSVTIYHLPDRLLVRNAIGRYSIGDRTPGITYAADGSFTIFVQSQKPMRPDELTNWLPAPCTPDYSGRFALIFRLYWPDKLSDSISYVPPTVLKVYMGGSKL